MIILLILAIMFAPPIVLFVLENQAKPDKKASKTYYIIAGVYLLIGLGICGSIIGSL